jgi:hypothetical protein
MGIRENSATKCHTPRPLTRVGALLTVPQPQSGMESHCVHGEPARASESASAAFGFSIFALPGEML